MMADVLNIAPAPGLPPLLFGGAVDAIAPLVADSLSALAGFGVPVWGVFSQDGTPTVIADTVTDLGYTKAYQVADFPIEDGGFAAFNRVETPFEARVRFVSGGSAAVRETLLSSVESVIGTLELFDVVTPDRVYVNASLTRMEYRRTNQEGGASLLSIDVSLQEVRIVANGSASNTADPASADQQNGGTVQPQTPTNAQITAAGGTPVTTPLPATLGGGIGGLPVDNSSAGGIGSA